MKNKVLELTQEFILITNFVRTFESLQQFQKDQLLIELLNDEELLDIENYYSLCDTLPKLLKEYSEGSLSAENLLKKFLFTAHKYFKDYLSRQFEQAQYDLKNNIDDDSETDDDNYIDSINPYL